MNADSILDQQKASSFVKSSGLNSFLTETQILEPIAMTEPEDVMNQFINFVNKRMVPKKGKRTDTERTEITRFSIKNFKAFFKSKIPVSKL